LIRIEGKLEDSSGPLWGGHVSVSTEEVAPLLKGDKRLICTLNGSERYHAALLGDGMGGYFILVNKARAKKLGLRFGDPVIIELIKDKSKYGMEMPEEFEVLLEQDDEGSHFIESLTPGKKTKLDPYHRKC